MADKNQKSFGGHKYHELVEVTEVSKALQIKEEVIQDTLSDEIQGRFSPKPTREVTPIMETKPILTMSTSRPSLFILEEIRKCCRANKILTKGPRSYRERVIKQVALILGNLSEQPGEGSTALNTIRTVFKAYEDLADVGDSDENGKLLIARLEETLELNDDDDDEIQFLCEVKAPQTSPFTKSTPESIPTSSQTQENSPEVLPPDQSTATSSSCQTKDLATPIENKGAHGKGSNSFKKLKLRRGSQSHSSGNGARRRRWRAEVHRAKRAQISAALIKRRTVVLNNSEACNSPNEAVLVPSASAGVLGTIKFFATSSNEPIVNTPVESATCDEMISSMKGFIRSAVGECLQNSGSIYTLISKGSYFNCHLCTATPYRSLQLLAAHIWSQHTEEPPVFKCPFPCCPRKYKHPAAFLDHVKNCQQNSEIQHQHGGRPKGRQAREKSSKSKLKRRHAASAGVVAKRLRSSRRGRTGRNKAPCPHCGQMPGPVVQKPSYLQDKEYVGPLDDFYDTDYDVDCATIADDTVHDPDWTYPSKSKSKI